MSFKRIPSRFRKPSFNNESYNSWIWKGIVLLVTSQIFLCYHDRVMISNADFSLSRGDIEQALEMLRKITPDQRYVL